MNEWKWTWDKPKKTHCKICKSIHESIAIDGNTRQCTNCKTIIHYKENWEGKMYQDYYEGETE